MLHLAEARRLDHGGEGLLVGKAPDRFDEIPVGVGVAGDRAPHRRDRVEGIEVVDPVEHRRGNLTELEAEEASARLEDAPSFGQRPLDLGHVADAEGDRVGVEPPVGKGQRLRVALDEAQSVGPACGPPLRRAALADLEEFAEIQESERGTIITLGGTVLFATNEATLLPIAQQRLDRVAQALLRLSQGRRLVIEGHTDDRGSADFNRRLSAARAEAVRAYLVARGVPPDLLVAIGKGEDQPVATNATPEGRANNRRVEIVISPPQAALR